MARVLICDDEAVQRQALRVSLERLAGLPLSLEEILEASHGRQAIELCQRSQLDIIFLDLRMPVLGGLDAAREILRLAPATQVVILTAYDEFNFAQEAIEIGVEDYLLKPASRQDLQRVMQKAMVRLQQRQAEAEALAELQQRVQAARPLIQGEYVSDLLFQSRANHQSLEEKRQFLGLSQHPRQVWVIELDDLDAGQSGRPPEERQLRKERAWLVVERELADQYPLLYRLGGDRLAVLLPLPGAAAVQCGRPSGSAQAESLRRAILRSAALSTTIGIGQVVDRPEQLQQSYHDALQALWHKSLLGRGGVIHISDVVGNDGKDLLSSEEELLLQSIRMGDQPHVDCHLPGLLEQIEQQECGRLSTGQWRLTELLVLMTRAALLGGANSQQATRANTGYLQQLMQATVWPELVSTVRQAAGRLTSLVLAERSLRHQKLMERAMQHMQQHYAEALTLEDMARVVYLSPFYFSHVFKEQTGMTFVEYLTSLRLNAAKQLLRDSPLQVGQIAERVGYSDVNYFSRVFKKVVGVTPTDFRARLTGLGS